MRVTMIGSGVPRGRASMAHAKLAGKRIAGGENDTADCSSAAAVVTATWRTARSPQTQSLGFYAA
jgi:hypothetical protein